MRLVAAALVVLLLACVPLAVADTAERERFPGGTAANSSTLVGIDADPAIAVTNEPIQFSAVNLSEINDTADVFVSWDFDGDGIADATGHNASRTYGEPGTVTVRMYATDGETERIVSTNVTIEAGVAPVVKAPPRDPDGDGRYEDVNGDGQVDRQDVLDYYDVRDQGVIRNQANAFDFDGDGTAGTVSDTLSLNKLLAR
jgi:PKD repeat protein